MNSEISDIMNMNKGDLKKLTESQLIKLLLKQDRQAQKPITPPRTGKWKSLKPIPRKSVNEYEEQFRD